MTTKEPEDARRGSQKRKNVSRDTLLEKARSDHRINANDDRTKAPDAPAAKSDLCKGDLLEN